MTLEQKSINELLELAVKTTSLDEMFFLKDHPSMNVRRALAKNHNINENILNELIDDPVQNVSYVACNNLKSSVKREYHSELRPCVICPKDEKDLYCVNCEKIEDHQF